MDKAGRGLYPEMYPQAITSAGGTSGGTPPGHAERMEHALDPDYATIGGILIDAAQLPALRGWLRPEDFASPLCGELFELMSRMHDAGIPVDAVTVLGELRHAGRLRPDGYPAGDLIAMVDSVPSAAMTPHYARLVLEGAVFRGIEQAGTKLVQLGRRGQGAPEAAFAAAAGAWSDLADVRERWELCTRPGDSADPVPLLFLPGADLTLDADRTLGL